LHAAFSLFILVVQGMLYSSHGDLQEQESTTPQAVLKGACGCGATCLLTLNVCDGVAIRQIYVDSEMA
jgi:hypothetical protein